MSFFLPHISMNSLLLGGPDASKPLLRSATGRLRLQPKTAAGQARSALAAHPTVASKQPGTKTQRHGEKTAHGGALGAAKPAGFGGHELGWPTDFQTHYTIGALIGSGSYGLVYEAICNRTGDVHAVKVLRKESRGSGGRRVGLRRAAREAAAMEAAKGLPGVVQLLAKYEAPHVAFLVTELLTGGDLLDAAQASGGCFSEAQLAFLLGQCLATLCTLHERARVVHADVKPSNWMLASPLPPAGGLDAAAAQWARGAASHSCLWASGNCTPDDIGDTAALGCADGRGPPQFVRAVDLGSSQLLPASATAATFAAGGGRGLRRRVGTPAYQAPEVSARDYDERSDVFSLGVTFYQLAAGRLPFWPTMEAAAAASRDQAQRAIATVPVDFGGQPWASMSPGAAQLLAAMLRRDPAERPSAREALQHPWLEEQRVALIERAGVATAVAPTLPATAAAIAPTLPATPAAVSPTLPDTAAAAGYSSAAASAAAAAPSGVLAEACALVGAAGARPSSFAAPERSSKRRVRHHNIPAPAAASAAASPVVAFAAAGDADAVAAAAGAEASSAAAPSSLAAASAASPAAALATVDEADAVAGAGAGGSSSVAARERSRRRRARHPFHDMQLAWSWS